MFSVVITVIFILLLLWYIYDRYVQREHTLIINYPIIGRFRYLFESVREPFRQYFGGEYVFDSRDKIEWVYKASRDRVSFVSFAPNEPQRKPIFMLKHSFTPLNEDEVKESFCITFGKDKKYPFYSKSIISRSAMSDGSISPEGTKAFAIGAKKGNFAINTGEGGLTTNFLVTHESFDKSYMEVIELNSWQRALYKFLLKSFNRYFAINTLRAILLDKKIADTYSFHYEDLSFFRVNWNAPLDNFPKEVPKDIPSIILQIGSGLYGVRDKDGNFDESKYQKVMRFCKMTEIKIAQGAKQTGGKLTANKVSDAIAYYRGVEAHKDLYSPNRFPYAKSVEELFDFIEKLQKLSQKPVGFKIVISSQEGFVPIAQELKKRVKEGRAIPDFITIDGGEGGSATAPIELMERIGLNMKDAIYLADEILKEYEVRDKIKIIASGKILTADNVIITLALGADMVSIARGFMLSAGCIRAKVCSGVGKHQCPVGLATQDKSKRKAFIVHKHAQGVANYHKNLIKNIKMILAVMGLQSIKELNKDVLLFVDEDGYIHQDVKRYMSDKLNN